MDLKKKYTVDIFIIYVLDWTGAIKHTIMFTLIGFGITVVSSDESTVCAGFA